MPDNQNSSECRHDWVTDGLHPTACCRCGIPSSPAPAMLNGVEGLMAKWRDRADHMAGYSHGHRHLLRCVDELEAALRAAGNQRSPHLSPDWYPGKDSAADNRDAAGGDSHAFAWRLKFIMEMAAHLRAVDGLGIEQAQAEAQAAAREFDATLRAPTPTAAPAGEAVALSALIEAAQSYADAEEALANRELNGINAEPHDKLQHRVHAARRELDAAIRNTHPPAAEVREVDEAMGHRFIAAQQDYFNAKKYTRFADIGGHDEMQSVLAGLTAALSSPGREGVMDTELARKMTSRADADGLPDNHDLRLKAAAFEEGVIGFYATPQTINVKQYVGRWARARRAWSDYSGEPLL